MELVQSLSMLALHDLKALKLARAWNTIGTAARLEAARSCRGPVKAQGQEMSESSSRCYWSVHILESYFSPQYMLLNQHPFTPKYPRSAECPPPLRTCYESENTDIAQTPDVSDDGVNSSLLKIVSVWGGVVSYTQGIRWKKLEYPWEPMSRYNQLTQSVYEFEDGTAVKHLFRNTSLSERSPSEIAENLDYWRPWILMQMTHHAASAVLNHPFIHMVALRVADRRAPPRLFLQSVIDQALYHSKWVVRFIQICNDVGLDIRDPLIAQLVAATATVLWLFKFAGDTNASARAGEGFETCETYLRDASATWPHITGKSRQGGVAEGVTTTFRPSTFWKLLDPLILENIADDQSGHDSNSRASPMGDATLRITTHILHPVDEHTSTPTSATTNRPALTSTDEDEERLCFNDLLSLYASSTDLSWLQPDNGFSAPLA
ncbi:unnamed protein product [Clonostachys byssicola]|uniref:Transcription factor domain-containing protein n=1 Tax=Clonostachys byssicola TaxID=160290 RepID=A0A9N9XYV2_9HYPO|nr:unnamed protein product [Clonostachys byssicola]